MRTRRLPFVYMVITPLLLTIALGTTPVAAQFGGLGAAARRAQEELRKKREAEDQAKNEAEAKEAAAKAAPPAAATPPPAPQPAAAAQPTTPAPATAPVADAPPAFETFSKFDFVPGERVVALEDFTQDAVGDFPARWNTNAAAEIVTISGQQGRWMKLTRAGFFTPEFITDLPENVTVEFDLAVPPKSDPGIPLYAVLAQLTDLKRPADWQSGRNTLTYTSHPSASGGGTSSLIARQDAGETNSSNSTNTKQLTATNGKPVHIAMWRQRQRVRVYMNEEKVWDVPRAVAATAQFNALIFFVGGGCTNCEYYLANIRVATGAPDTRNKIITEGKWVSHGILFDVNSDRLKGESYGSLKEIAGVLTESADLKVQIVGHTDADGDAAANLDLSKRRAASVKAALATEFKIDAGRMDTDGKGEAEPVDKNETPAGKANNRRVEFIRK